MTDLAPGSRVRIKNPEKRLKIARPGTVQGVRIVAGPPGPPGSLTGAAGGDLAGSYPNPTLRTTLQDPSAATPGLRTLGAGAQQAAAGNHTHSGGSGLLAITSFRPATDSITSYSTTSSTLVSVDATNLTVTFTAPLGGKVLVRLEAITSVGSGTEFWAVTSGGGTVAQALVTTSTLSGRVAVPFYVTGLIPGNTYTYTWAWSNNATQTARIGGGPTYGSIVMEIWSA